MVIPWASFATKQAAYKALSLKGCAADLLKRSGAPVVIWSGIVAMATTCTIFLAIIPFAAATQPMDTFSEFP